MRAAVWAGLIAVTWVVVWLTYQILKTVFMLARAV